MTNVTWLADVLREAGLKVEEVDGWKERGRPGTFGPVKGVICHHTGSNPKGGNTAAMSTILNGRPEDNPPLHGPLSQLLLARDGTFYVVAAGRCNHAGKGKWQGVTDGNRYFVGIEAENNGMNELWPHDQIDAYARGVAAILKHVDADAVMCAGHKEYALPKGRKLDPTFDMIHFRENVESFMNGARGVARPLHEEPARAMLRKGDQGDSVKQLQRALGIKADGAFGPKTEDAVRAFQFGHRLTPDGKVGPKTWAALGIK